MRIPEYVAIAQWALLLALATLVIVMYRQLGRALVRPKDGRELGPPVGSQAIAFDYTKVADGEKGRMVPGDGQAILLAFVDPTCPACERLVEALDDASDAGELRDMRVLLVLSDPPSYLQISDAFRSTRFEIGQINREATLRSYRANATPLLVAVDPVGVVAAAGSATQVSQVQAFSRSCRTMTAENASIAVVQHAARGAVDENRESGEEASQQVNKQSEMGAAQ